MKTPKLIYFDQEDILHLLFADGEEDNSVELSPTITVELNAQGEVIGIEILQASDRPRWRRYQIRLRRYSSAGYAGAYPMTDCGRALNFPHAWRPGGKLCS